MSSKRKMNFDKGIKRLLFVLSGFLVTGGTIFGIVGFFLVDWSKPPHLSAQHDYYLILGFIVASIAIIWCLYFLFKHILIPSFIYVYKGFTNNQN